MKLPGIVQFRLCTLTNEDLAQKISEQLAKMYDEPVKVPSRNIPARPDEDFDLLIGELIVRFIGQTALIQEIKEFDIKNKMEAGSFLLNDDLRRNIHKALSMPY